jgi:hypothetical protein
MRSISDVVVVAQPDATQVNDLRDSNSHHRGTEFEGYRPVHPPFIITALESPRFRSTERGFV